HSPFSHFNESFRSLIFSRRWLQCARQHVLLRESSAHVPRLLTLHHQRRRNAALTRRHRHLCSISSLLSVHHSELTCATRTNILWRLSTHRLAGVPCSEHDLSLQCC